jgi:tRNA-specific 2-thiouridylase
MNKRVVVGLSGGVDSAVTALLLQREGYEVVAIFMRNWHDESVVIGNECPWIDDSNDAMLVAEHLGIPFHVLDLSAEYKKRIVDYMFREYQAGYTPNPDILCNREIKFDVFLQAAMNLKADYVATGHYARKGEILANGKTVYQLFSGLDPNKDQSYFLCQLSQAQLSKALFPIGHLLKSEVREIAQQAGLPVAAKKDSQGLCFIGKVKLPVFLQQQLEPKEGKVIEVPDDSSLFPHHEFPHDDMFPEGAVASYQFSAKNGRAIGTHHGAHFYTIGQRKGLGVGGKAEPLFIVNTDTKDNLVYVGQGEHHRALYRRGLLIRNEDIHWIREDLALEEGESDWFDLRIRYRQPLTKAKMMKVEQGMYIVFDEMQRGIARGQFAAWYRGEELLGSGAIA